MNFIKTAKSIISTGLIFMFLLTGIGYCIEATEYQIKGAMMMNFIKFVDWPDQSDDDRDEITIGIMGKVDFGDTLSQLEGRTIKGKQIAVRRISTLNQLADCQVLFVGASESHRCYQILREVSGAPVLTIGEDQDFIRLGGIIRFYYEENHIHFEINQAAAMKSDLKLSAKLLEVAAAIR